MRLRGDLEGRSLSPSRALSVLLPNGEELLFRLIKKEKEEALHRPSAHLWWRPEEKRATCLMDISQNSQNQTEKEKKKKHRFAQDLFVFTCVSQPHEYFILCCCCCCCCGDSPSSSNSDRQQTTRFLKCYVGLNYPNNESR